MSLQLGNSAVLGDTFMVRETHGRVLRAGNRLISHSQDAGWQPLHAAIFEEAPFRETETAIGHPSLIYHLSRPTEVRRKIEDGRPEQALIGPRRFCLTPGDTTAEWQHGGHPEILQVYLRKSVYAAAVREMYGGDESTAEVVPRFAVTDPLLEQLAVALMTALRTGSTTDRLYIETLAQMMAVHMARAHSTRARAGRPMPVDGLARRRMQRLLEYIEAHLDGDLSLEAMAAEVDLSPFHLSRVFKAELGQSPHQYVLGRRVELAKALLRDTAMPVASVAQAAGFSSQSHLSGWFRRNVGTTPAVYRRQR